MKIEYSGDLNKNFDLQNNEIISYTSADVTEDENGIPTDFLDNGIFKDYYKQAYKKLKEMSLDEKIAQILLVRYPDDGIDVLRDNQFGGYENIKKDFKDGVKLYLEDNTSWVLVRPSGTEPLLRIYFESDSLDKIEKFKK